VTSIPAVVISASIAFDHVMTFNGSFKDHLLLDKAHVLSVSFLLESLKQQRGGVGGNIAYSLALLGVTSRLVGAVGQDFPAYEKALRDLGVDLSGIVHVPDDFTSNAYMNADLEDNQIAAFYPGAGGRSGTIDIRPLAEGARYGLVGATAPDAMVLHSEQIVEAGVGLVFDPAQQIVILTGEQLKRGIELAEVVVGNDYEFGMMEKKSGLTIEDIADRVPITVITFGGEGSEIRMNGQRFSIPIATAEPMVGPTGGGDAYRAGLLAGLLLDKEPEVTGRIAALAATYAVEHQGTQEHMYSPESFVSRFNRQFPDFAGTVDVSEFVTVAPLAH
jgi:adenosine kinase